MKNVFKSKEKKPAVTVKRIMSKYRRMLSSHKKSKRTISHEDNRHKAPAVPFAVADSEMFHTNVKQHKNKEIVNLKYEKDNDISDFNADGDEFEQIELDYEHSDSDLSRQPSSKNPPSSKYLAESSPAQRRKIANFKTINNDHSLNYFHPKRLNYSYIASKPRLNLQKSGKKLKLKFTENTNKNTEILNFDMGELRGGGKWGDRRYKMAVMKAQMSLEIAQGEVEKVFKRQKWRVQQIWNPEVRDKSVKSFDMARSFSKRKYGDKEESMGWVDENYRTFDYHKRAKSQGRSRKTIRRQQIVFNDFERTDSDQLNQKDQSFSNSWFDKSVKNHKIDPNSAKLSPYRHIDRLREQYGKSFQIKKKTHRPNTKSYINRSCIKQWMTHHSKSKSISRMSRSITKNLQTSKPSTRNTKNFS